MRAPKKLSMSASLVCISLFLTACAVSASESSTAANRAEKRIILFRAMPAGPQTVSPRAHEQLTKNNFEREILYTQWVKLNDVDPSAAAVGDRILLEVSRGESFELVVTDVHKRETGTSWYAKFPDSPATALYVYFLQPRGTSRPITFWRANFQVATQARDFEVLTADELPGWAMLRENKLGSGTHLNHGDDTGGPAAQKRMKQESRQAEEAARKQ